jgi:hypothetical protein
MTVKTHQTNNKTNALEVKHSITIINGVQVIYGFLSREKNSI